MATRIIQDQLDMSAQTVLKTDHPAPDSLGFLCTNFTMAGRHGNKIQGLQNGFYLELFLFQRTLPLIFFIINYGQFEIFRNLNKFKILNNGKPFLNNSFLISNKG